MCKKILEEKKHAEEVKDNTGQGTDRKLEITWGTSSRDLGAYKIIGKAKAPATSS